MFYYLKPNKQKLTREALHLLNVYLYFFLMETLNYILPLCSPSLSSYEHFLCEASHCKDLHIKSYIKQRYVKS